MDIEKVKEGETLVIEKNNGKRFVPTIFFSDGSMLVEPSNADLAGKLGLKTTASKHHYNLLIAGGDEYSGIAMLLSTGSRYKRLGVPERPTTSAPEFISAQHAMVRSIKVCVL